MEPTVTPLELERFQRMDMALSFREQLVTQIFSTELLFDTHSRLASGTPINGRTDREFVALAKVACERADLFLAVYEQHIKNPDHLDRARADLARLLELTPRPTPLRVVPTPAED